MDGEYTLFAGILGETSQPGTGSQGALTIDFRLPVSDAVTLYAQGGFSSSTIKYDETYAFYGSESSWSSVFIGFGARIYFIR